jgi:hypothetical protein
MINNEKPRKFNLEERTAKFGENIIDFSRKIKSTPIKETRHWIRMIAKAFPEASDEARNYWREANELNLIFSAIVKKSKEKRLGV